MKALEGSITTAAIKVMLATKSRYTAKSWTRSITVVVTEEEEEAEADMTVLIVGLLEEVSESRTSRAVAEAHLPKFNMPY